MTCKECGYYLRSGTDISIQDSSMSPVPQTTSTTSSGTYTASGSGTYTASGSGTYTASGSGSSQGTNLAKRVAIVIAVLMGLNIIGGAIYAVSNINDSFRDKNSNGKSSAESGDSSGKNDSQSGGYGKQYAGLPRTGFFQELASIIFDKDCADITPEEFASVTALEIDFDNNELYYQVDYVDGIDLTFDENVDIDLSDLRFFPGLEWISLVGEGLDSGDLDGLENLSAVYSENSLKELCDIIPYPENIIELSVYDSFLEHNLSGVQNFPNLQYLSVQYYGLEDISALNDMPGLLGLALVDCDRLTDYSPLMNMANLEQLNINSPQLKTIDFVNVMPNLTYLRIEDSQISDIDAIANCPNLTSLYLMNNYSVDDYSVVGNLVNLTDLAIFKDAHAPIPSLEMLTHLERALFSNLWDDELPLVTAAGNIKQLYLENNYDDGNLERLADLPLTWLAMADCSITGEHPLAFLTQLSELTYLDLTETYVFGNIEDVFGIPSLEYLYLKEATGVIDFDHLPANENLTVLDVSGLTIKADAWGDEHYDIKDHYDMFEKYPNVEYLYAASLGIDNIEFVAYMPNLQFLNIIENNVTSLKPLESLNDFHTVLCGDNSILENVSEDSGIYVDTDTKYYPYQ